MCKSAKVQFAELGVEVYEVGAWQARGWFGWLGHAYTGRNPYQMSSMCETMRKGAYLVVVGYACFGYQGQSVSIYGDGSVRDAVFVVRKELDFNEWAVSDDYYSFSSTKPRYQHEVEIWHLVDDYDLWFEWERMSAQYVALNSDLDDEVVLQSEHVTLQAFRSIDSELGDVRYKYFLARLFGIPTGMSVFVDSTPISLFEAFSPDGLTPMESCAESYFENDDTARTYGCLDDVLSSIETALGDFAGDYDVRAIADDISFWQDGRLFVDMERPDFWQIVESHDVSTS